MDEARINVAGKTYLLALTGSEQVPGERGGITIQSWLCTKPDGTTYGFFAKNLTAATQMVRETYA